MLMARLIVQPIAQMRTRPSADYSGERMSEQGWNPGDAPVEGSCSCGDIRYRLLARPLIVHCCHCRWCQRETGAAFAINAMLESDRLQQLAGEVQLIKTPSESGQGQTIARCPACQVALWSYYAAAGPHISFVRVGTLDNPDLLPPEIHIFTESKQPWVSLPDGVAAVPAYYDRRDYWPPDRLQRYQALLPTLKAFRSGTSL